MKKLRGFAYLYRCVKPLIISKQFHIRFAIIFRMKMKMVIVNYKNGTKMKYSVSVEKYNYLT